MATTPVVSAELLEKLAALDPPVRPILDATFVEVGSVPIDGDGNLPKAEQVWCDDGFEYVSSPANDWALVKKGAAA